MADQSAETTALHTAAHLLLAGLRQVLGDHVLQKGSNITAERLRFDFNHDKKLTSEQLSEVEKFVNDAIASKAVVSFSELPKTEAKESGVSGNFWDKYPDIVKVYTIQDAEGKVWSREVCGYLFSTADSRKLVQVDCCVSCSALVQWSQGTCFCIKEVEISAHF
ncbi:MAG: hypothetical protein K2N44_01295 [Lachnospiraceae bacterium]|nr:hypothetical protein [Lachnospiraceae bacterium]